jgi:hypothetical protein
LIGFALVALILIKIAAYSSNAEAIAAAASIYRLLLF